MPATQANTLARNPNQLNLVQVNQYERRINANITRVWENVLDWEHLPWLHDTSFDYVALDEAGEWGWRTWSNADKSASVELSVNRERSEYVARSYDGDRQVSEIWTELTPTGDQTDIKVTFELPDIPPQQVEKLGALFLSLYEKLWDEDEQMMVARQSQLDRKFSPSAEVSLRIQKPLSLPTTVELGNRDWTLRMIDGKTIVHSATCPHLLGPLDHQSTIDDRHVTCPWHGYQFDVITGRCIQPEQARCTMRPAPDLQESETEIILQIS